jgi:hypothetical protein
VVLCNVYISLRLKDCHYHQPFADFRRASAQFHCRPRCRWVELGLRPYVEQVEIYNRLSHRQNVKWHIILTFYRLGRQLCHTHIWIHIVDDNVCGAGTGANRAFWPQNANIVPSAARPLCPTAGRPSHISRAHYPHLPGWRGAMVGAESVHIAYRPMERARGRRARFEWRRGCWCFAP